MLEKKFFSKFLIEIFFSQKKIFFSKFLIEIFFWQKKNFSIARIGPASSAQLAADACSPDRTTRARRHPPRLPWQRPGWPSFPRSRPRSARCRSKRQRTSTTTTTATIRTTAATTSTPWVWRRSTWTSRPTRCVNLWIERWRRCDFIIFYFKTVFSSYKTARISAHIRHLFIDTECLLIGCVSYIK